VSEDAALIYLETDDEVTSVVRRIRDTAGGRVVLVAPGRSRATSSVVALRLLARAGDDAGRKVGVVGDALTRSLAAEAGLESYRSVEDARGAVVAPPGDAQSRRASIHVVRGTASDETVAVPLATPATAEVDTETRPVPVRRPPPSRPRSRPSNGRSPARRAAPLAGVLAIVAAFVIGGGALGAVVLPAATVVITPRTDPIGPLPYDITIEDPERADGTVEGTAVVTATGTYTVSEPASGTVVLFNWTFFPVDVPAGTFVAAGEQAFATQTDVVVPRGRLTGDGRINAGDEPVAVVAAAPGPPGNVGAGEINVVVNEDVDARLRGFPENPEPRVQNPDPTSGGIAEDGPEIVQADVDIAVAALREDLVAKAADAVAQSAGSIFVDPVEPPAADIPGTEELVGERDQPEVDIGGTLAYDRLFVDPATVEALARERLAADSAAVPAGHELLPGAIAVRIGDARRDGERLVVAVTVSGASTAAIDRDTVLDRIRGLTAEDARAALEGSGVVTVDLWPGWVSTVPELDWRIDVQIAGPPDVPALSPGASGASGASPPP